MMHDSNTPEWARDEASDSSKDSLQSLTLSSDHDPAPEPTGRRKKKKRNGKAGKGGWFGGGGGGNGGAVGGYGTLKDYPVEVLRYKSKRGCCLSFFGGFHVFTLVAALVSAVAQVVDMFDTNTLSGPWWAMAQHLALRCYGVCFALGVVISEFSELDHCVNFLASWREMPLTRLWPVRGLIFIFVGLFGTESAHAHVGDTIVNEQAKTVMVVIGLSGTVLMVSGVLYFLMGIACCRRLKRNMVNELNEARLLLNDHHDAGPDDRPGPDEHARINV